MKICGFEKLSLVDFDNYTTCTLFTEGCNFRCPFCHNGPLVDSSDNPSIPQEEIFAYLEKRKNLIDAVCVTGGEPTLHSDLPELFGEIKKLGFFCKLDTNGTNPEMLKKLVEERLVDYVAMDIKSSPENYGKAIGIDGFDARKVLCSVEYLKESFVDYEFRTTLVAELVNDDDIEKIAEVIKGCKKYALQKFKEVDGCLQKGYTEVPKEKALEYLKILESHGINAFLRGYD